MSQIHPWENRWREGKIGFHLPSIHPILLRHGGPALWQEKSRILVPLCGKSLDLRALPEFGYQVTGIEAVPAAVQAFFGEAKIEPTVTDVAPGKRFEHKNLSIWQGDVFAYPAEPAAFDGIWDRAALIALEAEHRPAYAARMMRLLRPEGKMLLVSMHYDQARMQGPPWSVSDEEVNKLYGPYGRLDLVETVEVLGSNPRFLESGLSAVTESVWILSRNAAPA